MTAFQVEAPVRNYTGDVAGVPFQKGTGHVADDTKGGRAALEYFRRRGYGVTAVEGVGAEVATPSDPPVTVPPAEFDPSEHSVEDVLVHVGEADYAEALRVLDAEAFGKNRVTITKQSDEILAAKTTPSAPAGDDPKGTNA
ncbi:hypothetical protein OG292_19880 [Streptomyces sp. NBC_01511]|uniref:hypothetical protein n=1 Tax=Streptomyces sp. NBC_01511 TaxID=2903889 RepID=UPI00386D0A71